MARRLTLLLVVALALGIALAGCGKSSLVTSPADVGSGGVTVVKQTDLVGAMRVQEAHTPELMAMPGVVGTAVTADDAGKPAIMVLTENAMPAGRLPRSLEGYAVVENVTGKIVAFAAHTGKQTPPIQLGTSGGSVVDLANGYCCSGTLGSLVKKGTTQYILSNSHVFAGDVVSGGNGKVSAIGDDIMQPGYVDNNCSTSGVNLVADVSSLSTLYPPGSTPNVDCAIAQVRSGMVRTDGAILEVGTISATTIAPAVNMAVKKSGRTTGLTRSTISGLNATVTVGYETECAGSTFNKTFTGQIIIRNTRSRFLAGGDSGSLMVQDITTNPKAVGLLFAGSSSTAVANPISTVLSYLGATMVGQ